MVTKLKSISFSFENCEFITIDGKYVGEFLVDDLKTYFTRLGANCIEKMQKANTIAIEIHKDANVEYCPFGIEDIKGTVFDRFKEWNDITAIEFTLEDQYLEDEEAPSSEEYCYFVDWVGDSDFVNDAQATYISKDGNLYIVIAKDMGIENFFDLEMINDSEAMDTYWDFLIN